MVDKTHFQETFNLACVEMKETIAPSFTIPLSGYSPPTILGVGNGRHSYSKWSIFAHKYG